jgi:hypothetical protein
MGIERPQLIKLFRGVCCYDLDCDIASCDDVLRPPHNATSSKSYFPFHIISTAEYGSESDWMETAIGIVLDVFGFKTWLDEFRVERH